MDLLIDLERVLWHELGHFCLDLLESEANTDFSIDDLWVSYHKAAISKYKWGGGVKMIPSIKWEALVEDYDKTSFAMLGTISGCIFQTIFLKEFKHEKVCFEHCFCFQNGCSGRGDFSSYHSIASQLRKKDGRKEEFAKFTEVELFDVYYKCILANQKFLLLVSELIIKYRDIIFKFYKESENKDDFYYHFQKDELNILKDEVYRILEQTNLREEIIGIKEIIRKKMLA